MVESFEELALRAGLDEDKGAGRGTEEAEGRGTAFDGRLDRGAD